MQPRLTSNSYVVKNVLQSHLYLPRAKNIGIHHRASSIIQCGYMYGCGCLSAEGDAQESEGR